MPQKRYLNVGDRVRTIGTYSEVMMHMQLAGKPVEVQYLNPWCAQVYVGKVMFGSPVTTGEAGIYFEGDRPYIYEDDGPGDENPRQVITDITKMLEDAVAATGVQVKTISSLGL